MKRPGPTALSNWYMEQPAGDYTCTDCGVVGPKHSVQPQHPYYAGGREGVARCTDCRNRITLSHRAKRKEQLDAMPRCSCCKVRGTYEVGSKDGKVLLCGRHLKKVRRRHQMIVAGVGGLGLFLPAERVSRATIIEWAMAK